ncbi:hypothetical protein Gohar_024774 [Gossypium harknessii]|uniref:Uncharacterized protein n=1 Tax=Gossypium harknessii TaxID=34285 RepID=A0A7J9HGY9_9ROSI|nr:hypothetical protein [Gossypium harknessii]
MIATLTFVQEHGFDLLMRNFMECERLQLNVNGLIFAYPPKNQ